ncbi:MAG: hypothetical protein HC828_06810 [Blastochloris sp.]|nr:hypothetical protein [Blastochloris sp.]
MIRVYHRPWGLCLQRHDQQIMLTRRQLTAWGQQRQAPQQVAVWQQLLTLAITTRRLR